MFRGRNAKQNSRRRNAQIDTLIGGGTVLRGDIHFKEGLHIDGVVKGNVIAEGENSMLTMSENGRIEGEVRVHNIVLNGEVKGDVHALESMATWCIGARWWSRKRRQTAKNRPPTKLDCLGRERESAIVVVLTNADI